MKFEKVLRIFEGKRASHLLKFGLIHKKNLIFLEVINFSM
jgi:hypothetical protein